MWRVSTYINHTCTPSKMKDGFNFLRSFWYYTKNVTTWRPSCTQFVPLQKWRAFTFMYLFMYLGYLSWSLCLFVKNIQLTCGHTSHEGPFFVNDIVIFVACILVNKLEGSKIRPWRKDDEISMKPLKIRKKKFDYSNNRIYFLIKFHLKRKITIIFLIW